jgi:Zn-dependent M28 family amino/carboxypeptidase
VGPGDRAGGTLREVVEELGAFDRRAGSSGEHRAAEWLAQRLRGVGCEAEVQETHFHAGYAGLMRGLSLSGAAAGIAALAARRLRPAAAAGAALAGLAIADDISNGPRLARRLIQRREATWNVVAESGDPDAASTLVVLAHHDAAPTGLVFDDRVQVWFGDNFPGLLERLDTAVPIWWPTLAAHALITAGALAGRRVLIGLGLGGAVLSAAAFHDIASSPVVPGANDNLSGVAVLVALAERLALAPLQGLRVMLVSCGAEEVLQGGIRGFADRYFPHLDRERTWFVNLETVGSPQLAMLEGEGPIVMEDYHDRSFRDLVARCADAAGASLRRGLRARSSTDSVIPSRAGYPTATLVSINRYKALSNYHLMTDTPANVDYATVGRALAVVEALARELAAVAPAR